MKDEEYPDRLAALKLPSIERRRKRGDMIDLYRYWHGIYSQQPSVRTGAIKAGKLGATVRNWSNQNAH